MPRAVERQVRRRNHPWPPCPASCLGLGRRLTGERFEQTSRWRWCWIAAVGQPRFIHAWSACSARVLQLWAQSAGWAPPL